MIRRRPIRSFSSPPFWQREMMIFDAIMSKTTPVMPDFMSSIHDFDVIRLLPKSWMLDIKSGMTGVVLDMMKVDGAMLPSKNFTF
jgi:hypothetical protein